MAHTNTSLEKPSRVRMLWVRFLLVVSPGPGRRSCASVVATHYANYVQEHARAESALETVLEITEHSRGVERENIKLVQDNYDLRRKLEAALTANRQNQTRYTSPAGMDSYATGEHVAPVLSVAPPVPLAKVRQIRGNAERTLTDISVAEVVTAVIPLEKRGHYKVMALSDATLRQADEVARG